MLAFLFIYFISPAIISDPGIVLIVAKFALNLSNLYFESMPPIIAGYITNLNLAMIALTMLFAFFRTNQNCINRFIGVIVILR